MTRAYRALWILDRGIELNGYDGLVRQLTATDLGREEPTLLLTNQLTRPPVKLIGHYALVPAHAEDCLRRPASVRTWRSRSQLVNLPNGNR